MRKVALAALAAAVLVAGWMAWRTRGVPVIASRACSDCNLLLITIDTLRTDRLESFGGPPGLTPNLDRLAADGLRLTRTYSAAPLTLPAHTSILTAASPPIHGIR